MGRAGQRVGPIELLGGTEVPIASGRQAFPDFVIEENYWDAIVSIWAPLPSVVRRVLHKKVVNGLKPGGTFLLEAYTLQQLELGTGGGKQADLMMSLHSLHEELNGLRFDIAHEIMREVHEGRYHNGQSAVVQVLAYK